MIRTGTSYFITYEAACRYYREQNESPTSVARKIADGEIHVGEPPLKPGEWRELIDGKTRYAVVSP